MVGALRVHLKIETPRAAACKLHRCDIFAAARVNLADFPGLCEGVGGENGVGRVGWRAVCVDIVQPSRGERVDKSARLVVDVLADDNCDVIATAPDPERAGCWM